MSYGAYNGNYSSYAYNGDAYGRSGYYKSGGYDSSYNNTQSNYIGRWGWDSYGGRFYDNQGREVKVTIEGSIRKGAKVTLTYYVPQGEAIGYIIQHGYDGTWAVQGTYADEASTGKFWLTYDERTGSFTGTRTPFNEVGCIGCGLVAQPWSMSPANKGRECTTGYCSVM